MALKYINAGMGGNQKQAARRWPALIAMAGLSVFTPLLAQAAAPPTVTFGLIASQIEIDEGGIVEFDVKDKEYRDPSTQEILKFEADLSPVTWDFDIDGIDQPEAYGLYNFKQWFPQDRATPHIIKATHQGVTREVSVQVRNVLPRIHQVYVTPEPRRGEPVVFQAAVRDPGYQDELNYLWEFGDGATGRGPNAIHQYASAGPHRVTLSVWDEAGSTDAGGPDQRGSFTINVQEQSSEPAFNTLTVGGDINESGAVIQHASIVGSNSNPFNPAAGGACQVRLDMRTDRDDMTLTLTAQLDPGLATGHYRIGRTSEWEGMHQDDRARQGTFFADFAPPRSQAGRMFGDRRISGPFWSDRGRVSIRRFDSGLLRLEFEADLTENVPGEYEPRKVRVTGALAIGLGNSPEFTDEAGNVNPDAELGGLFDSSYDDAPGLRAYLCGGEEPVAFTVVKSNPGSNAINAQYQDVLVEVEFSQAVDGDSIVNPDTLSENLELYWRQAGGENTFHRERGRWIVSRQNPKVVQFIPQARLLPGMVYCVDIKGGENGVRSFGGSLLAGSSLQAPAEMARACDSPEDDEVGFAFSTRPELQSVWVDAYQASKLGPHAPIPEHSFSPIMRVYAWWQDALQGIAASAQVREVPVNIFGIFNGAAMKPVLPELASSPVATTLRRPDLYTDEERRDMRHTVIFLPDFRKINPTNQVFGVIQFRSREGVPLEPVFPGVRKELLQKRGITFHQHYYALPGTASCPADSESVVCEDPDRASLNSATTFALTQLPIDAWRLNSTPLVQLNVGPGADIETLATSITGRYVNSAEYDPNVSIIFVGLPADFYPNSENTSSIWTVFNDFPQPDVIFFEDGEAINPAQLASHIVAALLSDDDDACRFEEDSLCDLTPVQGFMRGGSQGNRHHAEGNGAGDRLVPLIKHLPMGEYNEREFHISAWNWAKLYKALRRWERNTNAIVPNS